MLQFRRELSRGRASMPLFGVLPLARYVPQDLHSVIDYVGSIFVGCLALPTTVPEARNAALGAMLFGLSASLLTDYRLSLFRLIPIEAHESLDYLLGAFMVALPFLFGFWSTTELMPALLIASGLALIGMASITDYRAVSRSPTL